MDDVAIDVVIPDVIHVHGGPQGQAQVGHDHLVAIGHALEGAGDIELTLPHVGVGVHGEAGPLLGAEIEEIAQRVPGGDVVPEQAVSFVLYRALAPLHPLAHLCQHVLVISVSGVRAPQGDDERHVYEHVRGVQGGGVCAPQALYLRPQLGGVAGDLQGLPQALAVHLRAQDISQLREDALQLAHQVGTVLRRGLPGAVGGVEEEQGHAETAAQDLVPLEHGAAAVIASEQEVGSGQRPQRPLPPLGGGDGAAGVGADAVVEPHVPGGRTEVAPQVLRPDHGAVVLGEDGDDPGRQQQLHGCSRGHPGLGFVRGEGLGVVGGHHLFHGLLAGQLQSLGHHLSHPFGEDL